MADSASLKLQWATKRASELGAALEITRPFSYVLQTNFQTGERSTFARRNETEIANCSLACGEVIQAIRSSLDHAYWDIVSPFVTTEGQRRTVQFPFSETLARLPDAIKNRQALKVSQKFYDAIFALQPHGEQGGNKALYLIDRLNIPDKHRELTPMGEYKTIDGAILRRQIPDFPVNGTIMLGQNGRDVVWNIGRPLGIIGNIVEMEVDVPIEVTLPFPGINVAAPVVNVLTRFIEVARDSIAIMRAAAS